MVQRAHLDAWDAYYKALNADEEGSEDNDSPADLTKHIILGAPQQPCSLGKVMQTQSSDPHFSRFKSVLTEHINNVYFSEVKKANNGNYLFMKDTDMVRLIIKSHIWY